MNTNTETQTTNATQTESGEKFFTQEQVNQIVSERLARERSKAATEQALPLIGNKLLQHGNRH